MTKGSSSVQLLDPAQQVLPDDLGSEPIFSANRNRWYTNDEVASILTNFSLHPEWQTNELQIRPKSGAVLLYSREKVRYRQDGYCWKKRKNGRTTREDHMKLKVQGIECIYGCYVHSALLPTFHRRCYWLLQNPDIVLVHYLNQPPDDQNKMMITFNSSLLEADTRRCWTNEEIIEEIGAIFGGISQIHHTLNINFPPQTVTSHQSDEQQQPSLQSENLDMMIEPSVQSQHSQATQSGSDSMGDHSDMGVTDTPQDLQHQHEQHHQEHLDHTSFHRHDLIPHDNPLLSDFNLEPTEEVRPVSDEMDDNMVDTLTNEDEFRDLMMGMSPTDDQNNLIVYNNPLHLFGFRPSMDDNRRNQSSIKSTISEADMLSRLSPMDQVPRCNSTGNAIMHGSRYAQYHTSSTCLAFNPVGDSIGANQFLGHQSEKRSASANPGSNASCSPSPSTCSLQAKLEVGPAPDSLNSNSLTTSPSMTKVPLQYRQKSEQTEPSESILNSLLPKAVSLDSSENSDLHHSVNSSFGKRIGSPGSGNNGKQSLDPPQQVLPDDLGSEPIFSANRNRWYTNDEVASILTNFSLHPEWQTNELQIRPKSGAVLLYSREKVRYRQDGYCWKKRKNGRTTREDHMKLKVQGIECIYGCYVHSALLPTFHRRCYWLLQNPDIVLVHYLNQPPDDQNKMMITFNSSLLEADTRRCWTNEEIIEEIGAIFGGISQIHHTLNINFPPQTVSSVKSEEQQQISLNSKNLDMMIEPNVQSQTSQGTPNSSDTIADANMALSDTLNVQNHQHEHRLNHPTEPTFHRQEMVSHDNPLLSDFDLQPAEDVPRVPCQMDDNMVDALNNDDEFRDLMMGMSPTDDQNNLIAYNNSLDLFSFKPSPDDNPRHQSDIKPTICEADMLSRLSPMDQVPRCNSTGNAIIHGSRYAQYHTSSTCLAFNPVGDSIGANQFLGHQSEKRSASANPGSNASCSPSPSTCSLQAQLEAAAQQAPQNSITPSASPSLTKLPLQYRQKSEQSEPCESILSSLLPKTVSAKQLSCMLTGSHSNLARVD